MQHHALSQKHLGDYKFLKYSCKWRLIRTIIAFAVIELAQQAAELASYSYFENFVQGSLSLLLLAAVTFANALLCMFLLRKGQQETNFRVFVIFFLFSLGSTVVCSEWGPWRHLPDVVGHESNELSRVVQIRNFKLMLLTLNYIYLGGYPSFGIMLYLVPALYLVLRYETHTLQSLQYTSIPVLLIIAFPGQILNSNLTKEPQEEDTRIQKDEFAMAQEKENMFQPHESACDSQALLDTLPEGVMILDENGVPTQMNEALLKIFECRVSEVVDKLFRLSDKDYAAQMSNKQQQQPVIKRADTISENHGEYSDITGFDVPSINSITPSPNIKTLSRKTSIFDFPTPKTDQLKFRPLTVRERVRHNSLVEGLKKYPINLFTHRNQHQGEASTTTQAPDSRSLINISPELPLSSLQEIPEDAPSYTRKLPAPAVVKRKLQMYEKYQNKTTASPDLKRLKQAEMLIKYSQTYSRSKFGLEAEEAKQDFSEQKRNLIDQITKVPIGSMTRLGNRGGESEPRSKENFSMEIDQIAEEQALSMKPHVDDILERLCSPHIRAAYETVGEAIEYALNMNLKSSPGLGSRSRIGSFERVNCSQEIVRSNSEIIPDGNLGKRGSISSNSSIVLNCFLKVSASKVKYLEVKIAPILHAGQKRLIVLVKDDTQKDIARRLHMLDKQKASALASTVHDLRAPLGVIISSLECLNTKLTDPNLLNSFISPASYAAKSLMFLVNDILDMYQINMKKKLKLSFQRCDVYSTLSSVIDIFRLKAEMKGLKLSLVMDENAPKKICTDPNRLQQIVINLLSNALKFTEKGEIVVAVRSYKERKLRISVTDTGIGIKCEDVHKIFERFGRVQSKETDLLNPQGIGLGLNTSNRLSKMLCEDEKMSGLRVDSVFGRGSEFSFIIDDFETCDEIPYSIDSHDEITSLIEPVPVSKITRTFNSIKTPEQTKREKPTLKMPSLENQKSCDCSKYLVVDDNEFSLLSTINILKTLGIQSIATAKNGKEALDRIMEKNAEKCCCSFRLIFMDCQMPVMDGITASKEIQKLVENNQLPAQTIVGLSGFSSEEIKSKCKQAGMDSVFVKPFTVEDAKSLVKY